MSTNSPNDTISLWCCDVAKNVDSPISLEEIRSMTHQENEFVRQGNNVAPGRLAVLGVS